MIFAENLKRGDTLTCVEHTYWSEGFGVVPEPIVITKVGKSYVIGRNDKGADYQLSLPTRKRDIITDTPDRLSYSFSRFGVKYQATWVKS